MKVEELRALDFPRAFSDFYSIAEAKENGIIPEAYHPYFDDTCECGSDIIMRSNRKMQTCCDPRCYIKMGYRLHHVVAKLGIKGVGPESCKTIMRYLKGKIEPYSNIKALTVGMAMMPPELGGMVMSNYLGGIMHLKKNRMTFPEMVSLLGIPGFDTSALTVLQGIDNIEHLVGEIEKSGGMVKFLGNRGVEDRAKAFHLFEFLSDILVAETEVFGPPIKGSNLKLRMVMSGRLYLQGAHIAKREFERLCNKLATYRGVRLFEVIGDTSVQTTSYFVISERKNQGKLLEALRREKYEGRKLIYSPEEFLLHVKSLRDSAVGSEESEEGELSDNDGVRRSSE